MPQCQTTQNSHEIAPTIRTLVLDDDQFERARIRRVSMRAGLSLEIVEVATISDMTAAIGAAHYDLILVDYRLTDGDGLDAIGAIRASPTAKDSAVIMITGQGRGPLVASAFHQGCQDFIEKDDISPDTFRGVVLTALERARQSKPDQSGPEWRSHVQEAFRDPRFQAEIRAALTSTLPEVNPPPIAAQRVGDADLIAGLITCDGFDFHS